VFSSQSLVYGDGGSGEENTGCAIRPYTLFKTDVAVISGPIDDSGSIVSLKSGPSKSPRPKPKFDYKHNDKNASSSVIFNPIELKPMPV
jgi:hypothetical protein